MAEARVYCSELARDSGVSLAGTAEPVDYWILLEHRGVWGARALDHNDLPPAAQAWIDAAGDRIEAATRSAARVQFIKQPGRSGALRLVVVFCHESQPGSACVDLADYAQLEAIDLVTLAEVARGGTTPSALKESSLRESVRTGIQPIHLVCTNGQRDLCCARFGLPVYDALAAQFPHQVWQTTHVGGHRYAPNVVCLPQGVVLGFVAPEQAVDLVRQVERGALPLEHLRGQCFYEPAAQLAAIDVRRRLGLRHERDMRLVGLEQLTSQRWRVRLATRNGPTSVEVEAGEAKPVQASCGASGIKLQSELRVRIA